MLRRLGAWVCLGILILLVFPVDTWAAGKPNIILITLDSVRADRMGFLGAHSGLTPVFDGIAKQGISFSQAYAQSPLTVASHATILTGTYPQTHRASEFSVPLAVTLPYLPDLLHAAGYRTAAFVGSIQLDPQNGPFQGYDRGFDFYDAGFHPPLRGQGHYQTVQRHDGEVIARATKWLIGNKQHPFFLLVNLHDPSAAGGLYDRSIAAADASVGKLVNFLRTQSLYDEAILLIASAHGESLGAHGEDTHGLFLYDETIHVPMLLKLTKNKMAGKQVKNRARLVDVAPALLEAAGIPVPSGMQGQSLLRIAQATSQADQPAYSRTELARQDFQCAPLESWRAGKYLYVRAPKSELYDLSADPTASRNLAQTSKATLETMAAQLESLDSRLGNESNAVGAGLTSSEMQKLASLGYVGLQQSGAAVHAASRGTDPKDVVALANKALAAMGDLDDGKPEKAISALRQVLSSQSNSYLAQFGMASALFQQQQYAEAIPYLHTAIELQPDSAWAHYTMGLSLMKTGDFKTAAVHLEIASGRLPGLSALHSTLAEVYDHIGRAQDAARERAAVPQGDSRKHD